ncbi:hypothetical protein BsWGS_12916 [Bradybaena similaris]
MYKLGWILVFTSLLVILCKVSGRRVETQLQEGQRSNDEYKQAPQTQEFINVGSIQRDRKHFPRKNADSLMPVNKKKFNKNCKYVCPYAKQADTVIDPENITTTTHPTMPTPPPIPTPSSSNSSSEVIHIPPLQVNGIFPSLTVTAKSGPARSECGTGAMMPWADKLYVVSYLSVPDAGSGTGLYAIDENFTMTTLANHNSTYANRLLHRQTNQIIIGAWIIDMEGKVRVFQQLLQVRVAATAEHLTHPESMVYMLGMDGPLWECNVTSLGCTQIFDLVTALQIPSTKGEQPHFKAAHTMNGRLVVASNTFEEQDFTGQQHGGRLAEWKGPGQNWTIIERTAFVEVTGRRNFGQVIYALGWDYRSVILKVFDPANDFWQTYRLPKASHAWDHLWQTEWPRIREVETERYLMDMHGLFYELSPLGWAGSTWGIRPISQHLRIVPDFTSFRGFLVLGGNQVSSIFDNNVVTGQSQSGLWFGKTDDLWKFGKPQGWGAVWRDDDVPDGAVSDPFLMTGFDHKVLHVIKTNASQTFYVDVQVDVTGTAGHRANEFWVSLTIISLGQGQYQYFVFPSGYSAHWVRLALHCGSSARCKVTAYFNYT